MAQGPRGLGARVEKKIVWQAHPNEHPYHTLQVGRYLCQGTSALLLSCLLILLPFTQSESWGEVTPEGVFT